MHPFGQGRRPSCVRSMSFGTARHAMAKGSCRRTPLPPCTPEFRRVTPPQRRPRCLPTLRVPGAFDQACDLVLNSRPNPTRGRSTPARPSTERRQRRFRSLDGDSPPATTLQSVTSHDCLCGFFKMPQDSGRFLPPPLLSTGSTVDSLRRKRPAFHVFRPLTARQRSRRVASNVPQIWTRSAF